MKLLPRGKCVILEFLIPGTRNKDISDLGLEGVLQDLQVN